MLLSFLLLLFSYLQPPRQVFCYGLSCNWTPIQITKMQQQLGYQISVGLCEKERRQRGRERPERRRCLPTIAIARAPSFSSRAGAAAVTGGYRSRSQNPASLFRRFWDLDISRQRSRSQRFPCLSWRFWDLDTLRQRSRSQCFPCLLRRFWDLDTIRQRSRSQRFPCLVRTF